MDSALKLKEQGKVKFIQMSGHNRKTFGKIATMKDSKIDIFMTRYNASHRGAEEDIFPHLPEEEGPGIIAYTATCWNKLLKNKKIPKGEKPLTASECYRFALSNPKVHMVLTGPKNNLEMDEALTALDAGPLSSDEILYAKKIGDYVY